MNKIVIRYTLYNFINNTIDDGYEHFKKCYRVIYKSYINLYYCNIQAKNLYSICIYTIYTNDSMSLSIKLYELKYYSNILNISAFNDIIMIQSYNNKYDNFINYFVVKKQRHKYKRLNTFKGLIKYMNNKFISY